MEPLLDLHLRLVERVDHLTTIAQDTHLDMELPLQEMERPAVLLVMEAPLPLEIGPHKDQLILLLELEVKQVVDMDLLPVQPTIVLLEEEVTELVDTEAVVAEDTTAVTLLPILDRMLVDMEAVVEDHHP